MVKQWNNEDVHLKREPSICHLMTYDRDPSDGVGAVLAENSKGQPRLCMTEMKSNLFCNSE